MASATVSAAADGSKGPDHEVPLWRLYLMRAACLYFVFWGFLNIMPNIVFPDPTGRGMTSAMLGGLWLLVFFGLRYPMKMVPLFLFEFVWKSIWLAAFGLPQWLSGTGSPRLSEDLFDIGIGPILFGLLIPWTYVWRHYIREPAERWR